MQHSQSYYFTLFPQVNVLVVPMLNKKLTSTNIGKCLLSKARKTIKSKFDSVAANCTLNPWRCSAGRWASISWLHQALFH